MTHVPVSSSHIESVAYDPGTNVMEVQFRNGHLYRYENVPARAHAQFVAAPSVGRHFHQAINGQFQHTLLNPLKHKNGTRVT